MLAGPKRGNVDELLSGLGPASIATVASGSMLTLTRAAGVEVAAVASGGVDTASQIADLESENARLKASLEKAIKDNEKMWNGVVQMKLAESGKR